MYRDEKARQEREAELAAAKSGDSQSLNNLIAEDSASVSQQDGDIESVRSKQSIASKAKSVLNGDLDVVEGDVPALSENHNQQNLMFTVHEDQKQTEAPEKEKATSDKPDAHGGMDYVAATLHAWNQCPTIVKKQMDDQYQEIMQLKEELRSANLKLNQRKQEFERHAAVDMKVDLIKHKDKIEAVCRQKLEDEKVKLNKKKV